MYFFRNTPHHRRSDSPQHDLVMLLIDIAILAIIIFYWPS